VARRLTLVVRFMKNTQKYFTWIEFLLVLVIIMIIAQFPLKYYLYKHWRDKESAFMANLLGISPHGYEFLVLVFAMLIFFLYAAFKIRNHIKKR
jgi:amino acid transporter